MSEEWRRLMARGTPPEECGDAMPVAPARGPVVAWMPVKVHRTEAGNWRETKVGYAGRSAARVRDAFDRMEAQMARASGRSISSFSVAQVEAGRLYASLVERHASRGVMCSSLEATHRSSSGASYIDALIAEGQRIERMRTAVGTGWAMEPRRAAPNRDTRRAIRLMTLVDLVCIETLTISQVLDRFGWSRKTTHISELRGHLGAALDRMHGL